MMRSRRIALMAVVLLVGAAWVWINRISDAQGPDAAVLPPAPAVGHPAPDFTLTTLTGETFRLSDLRGMPVVLNFWATWCPPCRAELPELEIASRKYAGQVAIIGVDQAETPEDVRAFAAGLGLTFPIPLDTAAEASRLYAVRSLPTTFFVDRQGIIRQLQVGPVTEATLVQLLKSVFP